MNKLFKATLVALSVSAQEFTTTEATTIGVEEIDQEAIARAHAEAEAAAQAAALAARITGSCWSCGVMNNVTDFGPQDDAADMYARCISEGDAVDCMDERTTCTVVERRDGAGWIMSLEAGCKARDACNVNQQANFAYNECQRQEGKPSKCVDCCLGKKIELFMIKIVQFPTAKTATSSAGPFTSTPPMLLSLTTASPPLGTTPYPKKSKSSPNNRFDFCEIKKENQQRGT